MVAFQRTDCVSTYTHCRSGYVQSHSFRSPRTIVQRLSSTLGWVIQHGHQFCPSSLSSKHEACFKLGFQEISFFPLWFCLCRTWRTNLPKGACALLLTSVDHDRAPVVGVRVNVLLSRYLIEPCGSGKSKLTYLCRADVRYVLSLILAWWRSWRRLRLFVWCKKWLKWMHYCVLVLNEEWCLLNNTFTFLDLLATAV